MHDYFGKNNEIEIKHKIKKFQRSKSHHLKMNVIYISVYIPLPLSNTNTKKQDMMQTSQEPAFLPQTLFWIQFHVYSHSSMWFFLAATWQLTIQITVFDSSSVARYLGCLFFLFFSLLLIINNYFFFHFFLFFILILLQQQQNSARTSLCTCPSISSG